MGTSITDFFQNALATISTKFSLFFGLLPSLSASQVDMLLVVAVLAILPILGILGSASWGRGTFRKFYGDFEGPELRKFLILAVAFGATIGAYWALRAVKDGYLNQMVGIDYIPRLKMLSLMFVAIIMFIFTNIVDLFKKHHLFFVVCGFYSICFFSIAIADWLNLISENILGCGLYLLVESLGSTIIAAVFWAFVANTTNTTLGKKGYPIIFIGGQIGGIVGTTFVKNFVQKLGHPLTLIFCTLPLLALPLIIEYLVLTTPEYLMLPDLGDSSIAAKKPKPGLMEGLRLIAKHPYLMGLAVVSTVYEVINTIIEFQFKKTAAGVYSKEFLTSYLASQGQALTILSFLFALIGTSFVVRILGARIALLAFPTLVALSVLAVFFNPSLSSFFIAVIVIKGFSYTLNNPVKELLYLPTSKDVKFKAKGFIDAIGGRASKATGSTITDIIRTISQGSPQILLSTGSFISLGIIGGWVIVAVILGHSYNNLVKNNKIIE